MWDGGEGEADMPTERQTCNTGRWSRVQLEPGFESEFYPCDLRQLASSLAQWE